MAEKVSERSNSNNEQQQEESEESVGLLGRLLKIGQSLLRVHLEFAQREASRDAGRIIGGVVMLVLAVAFICFALSLAHIALVVLVHDKWSLSWAKAIGVVAGSDALIGLICLLLGKQKLKQPMLSETRGLIKRTVGTLVG